MSVSDGTVDILLELVRQMVVELHPRKMDKINVTLDSSLERDLGIDSLGRVELLLRIGRAFDIGMPEQAMAIAETPRDLLRAIHAGKQRGRSIRKIAALPGMVPGEVEALPEQESTLLEVLDWHVNVHPDRTHIYLYGKDDKSEEISYRELQEGAQTVASGLMQRHSLEAGRTVAIMLPTGRDYFYSFFGILLAGCIPVPIYPPVRRSQIEDHLRRHASILANAMTQVLITVPEAAPLARLLAAQMDSLRAVVTVRELSGAGPECFRPLVTADETALIQYTSGSTGTPKGVVLTHANLLANIRAMGRAAEVDFTDIFVSWLPLYHDMGLIGAWLGSLYHAMPLVLMSPLAFLSRPASWLWAIHRHRGTLSAGPNFAYELCLSKVEDRDIENLDLSSWRMAFNGAESVSPETILRFSRRFAGYGFRAEALAPVYGLAESSVGLAFSPPGRGPVIDKIKRAPFLKSGLAVAASEDDGDPLLFAACGQPLPGHQVRVVDATGHEAGEREEGRLEFRGPSSTSGYFRNAEATRNLFHGEWLDSGDRAYMVGGDVYITGRDKDTIIRAGRNLYPYELEEAVGNHSKIRKGCVAVFGSVDHASGTERLVVLAETRETEPASLDGIRKDVENLAVDLLGTPPEDVVLAPPHTVLKTSSGKIRRDSCRQMYKQGTLNLGSRPVWWQIVRLAWTGVLPELRRGRRALTHSLNAAYGWALFGLFSPPVWIAVALLPSTALRRRAIRTSARLLVKLYGTPLSVQGLENLSGKGPCVLVANHSSYLDGIILAAALPPGFAYVAKGELTESFLARVFLRRIGTRFVERFDKQRGVDDARRISGAVKEGTSLIFFPEGTLGRRPGLLPFHMGAFAAAAGAGVPVVPLVLRGTRAMLRSGEWFPRRGAVSVTAGPPINPVGSGWAAAVKLRDEARAYILRYCGEPDLAFHDSVT